MTDNISSVLVRLFDTLKDATDKNEESTQELISQQADLVTHIKNLPIKDLKALLELHAKNSKTEVDTCSANVTTKTDDLMKEILKIGNKVSRMILVVIVAFTILMGTYVIIRNVAEKDQIYDYEAVEAKQSKSFDEKIDTLLINIRKEMKKLHPKEFGG